MEKIKKPQQTKALKIAVSTLYDIPNHVSHESTCNAAYENTHKECTCWQKEVIRALRQIDDLLAAS